MRPTSVLAPDMETLREMWRYHMGHAYLRAHPRRTFGVYDLPTARVLAPRPEARRYKQLRATLEAAHNKLHQEMHRNGIFHDHTPLHDHAVHREH